LKIFNEIKYAENMIFQGFIQKKYEYELKILAKYYFSKGFCDDILRNKIKEFCYDHIPDFNEVKYVGMIKRAHKYGENNRLFVVKSVRITQDEIDKIRTLNNLKIEKIAFVFLVLANINKQKYTLYMGDKIKYIQKINKNKKNPLKLPNISLPYLLKEKINNIFTFAKVYLRKKDRNTILRALIEKEFIIMSDKCGYKINFIHHNTKNTSLIIENFDDFILEYERLIGDNIGYCIMCNKPIRITSGRRKYCNKCSKIVEKENWVNRKRKQRENVTK